MRRGACIHYNGMLPGRVEPACAKGVDMYATFGKEPGIFMRLPCVQETRTVDDNYKPIYFIRDRKGHKEIPCSMLELPTLEQVAEADREMQIGFNNAMTAIKVAATWRVSPKPAQDRHEVIECPVCKGHLHLTQSSYNGHVHGKCETDKCVSWME